MGKNRIIEQARQMMAEGRTSDSSDLLLAEGYIEQLNPDVQRAYEELMPITDLLKSMLNGPVRELREGDLEIRRSAASWLRRQAQSGWSYECKSWLGSPRTTEVLMEALADEDAKVVEHVAGALAATIRQYFPDLRAFGHLSRLLKAKGKQTRAFAAAGLGPLHHPDRWSVLLPLLGDRVALVRQVVCQAIAANGKGSKIPVAIRHELEAALEERAEDADNTVRTIAQNALAALQDSCDQPQSPSPAPRRLVKARRAGMTGKGKKKGD